MNAPTFLLFDIVHQPEDPSPSRDSMFNVRALSFDRVHRGHVASSDFPLFRIPVELFEHVIRYLSGSDLKSLALVDRDCFRLASLSLFKHVRVDVDSEASHTLAHYQEASSAPFPIPRCVRRLTVSSSSSLGYFQPTASRYHDESSLHETPASLQSICCLITDSLQNLHILDWNGPAFHSLSLLEALQSSPVKHLRLKGTVLDPEASKEFRRSLPIETLDLQIASSIFVPRPEDFLFYRRLLQSIAPTLRQLRWKETTLMDNNLFNGGDMPSFPNLRSMIFDMISSDTTNTLNFFFGPHVKTPSFSLSMDSVTASSRKFLRTRGCVEGLKQFCWIDYGWAYPSSGDVLAFLEQNSQLETLHIPEPRPQAFIEEVLLPVIKLKYDSLTSLHLVWDAHDIPEQSLQGIASVSTLRHLWISAGNQGVRSTWEVDHNTALKRLSPLRLLESLAFSHDTYSTNAHPLAPRFCDYYATKALPVDLDVSRYLKPDEVLAFQGKSPGFDLAIASQVQMRRKAWESWHTERMTDIAEKYARTFKALRWCFVGQLPLGRDWTTGSFSIANDSSKREPDLSSLHKMMSMTIWRPV